MAATVGGRNKSKEPRDILRAIVEDVRKHGNDVELTMSLRRLSDFRQEYTSEAAVAERLLLPVVPMMDPRHFALYDEISDALSKVRGIRDDDAVFMVTSKTSVLADHVVFIPVKQAAEHRDALRVLLRAGIIRHISAMPPFDNPCQNIDEAQSCAIMALAAVITPLDKARVDRLLSDVKRYTDMHHEFPRTMMSIYEKHGDFEPKHMAPTYLKFATLFIDAWQRVLAVL